MTKPTENKPKAWRNDAVEKVTGRAKFADDLVLPNMLHAVPVYSRKYTMGRSWGSKAWLRLRRSRGWSG
jgi:hypothetical protein